jgi:CTP synthase
MGLACVATWSRDDAYQHVKQAYPYRNLSRPDFDAVLDFLAGGGESLRQQYTDLFGKIHLEADTFEGDPEACEERLQGAHAVLVPGGFGERGSEGKIEAARFARERNIPYFGICFGMQMAVIEAARNLAGFPKASSTEFGPTTEPVVGLMTEWTQGNQRVLRQQGGDLGGTMRLGAYESTLAEGSRIAEIYGTTTISERHRHRYEVNINYREAIEAKAGLVFAGLSPDGVLPETVERPDHPWFIGVQYHPELKSRPFAPHPLFASFIAAAVVQSRLV